MNQYQQSPNRSNQANQPASAPQSIGSVPIRVFCAAVAVLGTLSVDGAEKLASDRLPNLVRIHEKVMSGGLPEGDAAFEELRQRGVQTIISVDGRKPDVAAAAKHGLRYVHLPHGYGGIPAARALELAKAVRDLPGQIYIHCHHGRHRSPAAASVACVAAGLIPVAEASEILRIAGTNQKYLGLIRAANHAQVITSTELDQVDVQFQETIDMPPMTAAMLEIEQAHDLLRRSAEVRWRPADVRSNCQPAHQALMLREHFAELLRTDQVQRATANFQRLLRQSEQAATELEQMLLAWQASGGTEDSAKLIDVQLALISTNCQRCHEQFRDLPLADQTSDQKHR